MTGREKGVQTAPCATCGTELPLVTQPDGGTTTGPCSKCQPKPKAAEKASATTPSRERGTNAQEGTDG